MLDQQAQSNEIVSIINAREIAHDINNILSVVIGSIELSKVSLSNPEKMQKYLDDAMNAAIRIRNLLIKEILSEKKASAIEHPVDVASIINDVVQMLRSTLPENIEIQCNLIENMKVMVPATRISRAIMNMCINAVSAMRQGGGTLKIAMNEVSTPEKAVGGESSMPTGNHIQISISDTGCGISPEIMNKIFNTNFTTRKQGNGLGLVVANKVVKKGEGWITCDSRVGEGTTFNIFLPRYIPNQKNVPAKTKMLQVNKNARKKILFADDEHCILDLAKIVMEDQGYTVVVADDGQRAFDIFKNEPDGFAVAVLDIAMPEMNGDELADRIRKIRPDLPVIICSGNCDDNTRKRLCENGVWKVIKKPYLMKNLSRDIQEVLEK